MLNVDGCRGVSLVQDGYLLELWKEAQKCSSFESASVVFWNQLFAKYFFCGESNNLGEKGADSGVL
jgi:hypothetical protein